MFVTHVVAFLRNHTQRLKYSEMLQKLIAIIGENYIIFLSHPPN
jgi:hypothetical protein